jgi:hypothetical protein
VEGRAGRFVRRPSGYTAFVPAPLNPPPDLAFDGPLIGELAAASDAVGRLDGVAQTLPDPDLFVAMYVRREAVLSSQIEGTQSTLNDVLVFELDPGRLDLPGDVEEVVNYVRAMNYGLDRLSRLPLSLRLIREIHGELLASGRGAAKEPGEFRRTQNWIGPEALSLRDATFVPPPPDDMHDALSDLEKFLHATAVSHRSSSVRWPTPSSRPSTRSSTATAASAGSSSPSSSSTGACSTGRCSTSATTSNGTAAPTTTGSWPSARTVTGKAGSASSSPA